MSLLKRLIGTPVRTLSGLLAILLIADGAFDLWSGDYERALTAVMFALFNGYIAIFLLKEVQNGKLG